MNCLFLALLSSGLLLPSTVLAQASTSGGGLVPGSTAAVNASPVNAPPATPAASNAAPTPGTLTPSQPSQPPAPVSAGSAVSGSNPGGSFGVSGVNPVPTSPPVPTAMPGQSPLLSFPSAPNAAQTLPAAPPTSFSLVTPGVKPLLLTADGALMLAARQNLGVLAALREALAARSGLRSASALSPPIFTVGPALQMGGTTDGLLFQQPLELNGTRDARAGVGRARLRLAQAQALVQLQALVYTTRLNFYTLAQAQERLRLAQDFRQIAERFDVIAHTQVALGARPGIEQRQTTIEVARAKVQEAQAFGQEQAAQAALNAYLGRAALDPIETRLEAGRGGGGAREPASIPDQAPDPVLAQRQALAVRGEIAAAEAARDIPQAEARLSQAQGRPDIAPSFRISQITPTYMDAGLGVVITIPLDYGTRRNQIRQQEQTAQANAARVTGTQAQVRSEIVQATTRLNAAQEALRGYDGGLVAEAKAVLDDAQLGFRAGATTIIAVLEAQRTYRAILGERLDAQMQAALARAELDRAAGNLPPGLLTQLRQELSTGEDLSGKDLSGKDLGRKDLGTK